MIYHLVNHTGRDVEYVNSRLTRYDTEYNALSAALALEKIEVLNGDNVHLSVVDDRQRRLYEIKVARRKEVRK